MEKEQVDTLHRGFAAVKYKTYFSKSWPWN